MGNIRDRLRYSLEPVGTQLIQQKREKDRRRKPENNIVQADQQRILKNPGKVGRLKEQNSKCSSPTHSLPHIPLIGLKSLNASWMPYNGP